jgi:hypothetical protein
MPSAEANASIESGAQLRGFQRLLCFSGTFNIVMAAPLILPQVYKHYFKFLTAVNDRLALGGSPLIPPAEGVNALLINTAGIDLVLIGVFVLYAALCPARRWFIPAANAAGRTAFAGIIAYYVFTQDIARIVFVVGIIDVLISIAFVCYLIRLRPLFGVHS